MVDIKKLRKLAKKATGGPWKKAKLQNGTNKLAVQEDKPNGLYLAISPFEGWSAEADMELIAAMRNALPEMLDEIERLQVLADENAELQSEIEHGDYWEKRVIEKMENGGCPICFATDEAGHEEGCEWGDAEAENERLQSDIKQILINIPGAKNADDVVEYLGKIRAEVERLQAKRLQVLADENAELQKYNPPAYYCPNNCPAGSEYGCAREAELPADMDLDSNPNDPICPLYVDCVKQFINQERKEQYRLEMACDNLNKQIEQGEDVVERLRADLEVAQEREKRLRDALNNLLTWIDFEGYKVSSGDWHYAIEKARQAMERSD